MYDMKLKKRCNDAQLFLARLRENSRFRKSMCKVSSQAEMQGAIDSNGYDFDEYQLIRAVAEFMEQESEECRQGNHSAIDSCLLDLL